MTVFPTAVASRPPVSRRSRAPVIVGVAAVAALAAVVRLWLLAHGGALAVSNDYDDGVYYAAADAFVHGRWPYRDFLLLHPPGIVIALAPFAAIGSVLGDPIGMAAARLVFIAIGAANTVMITVIAGRRSRVAGLIAGVFAAVFFPLAYAERSTMLEPLATCCLLAAVLIARRGGARAAVAAGLIAGLSADVKIWYVVPVLVLAICQRGHRLRFAGGAVAAVVALGLPFLLHAPAVMIREVVFDQLGRPRLTDVTITDRLLALAGYPTGALVGAAEARDAERLAVVVLLLVGVAAVAAWRVRWARPFVVLTVVTAAVLLGTPSFFMHYVAFTAPWLAIALGVGWGEVLARVRRRQLRIGLAVLLVATFCAMNGVLDERRTQQPQPVAAIAPAAQRVEGCVESDDPGLLAELGVLSSDLQRGCRVWPDVTGWTYDADADVTNGVAVPRPANGRWQQDVMAYLLSGEAVIVRRRGTGLSEANSRRIAALPLLVRSGDLGLHAVR